MCWHLYKSISLRISPNTGQECALVYAQLHMGISLKLALKMVRNVRWHISTWAYLKNSQNGQECALAGRGGFEAIPEAQASIFCPQQGRGLFYIICFNEHFLRTFNNKQSSNREEVSFTTLIACFNEHFLSYCQTGYLTLCHKQSFLIFLSFRRW